jgi:cytochrome c oxidase subunit II
MQLDFMLQQSTGISGFYALLDLYLVLGVAVAAVVIGWFLFNIIRHREREHMPINSHAEGKPETWKTALTMVMISASILAVVETATLLSTGLVIAPQDPNAIHIKVTAQQFFFNFQYPNKTMNTNQDLWIPTGRNIILNITSKDVMHSLGIRDLPTGPVSEDAIAGEFNIAYIPAQQQTGTYTIFCFELCGLGHFTMHGLLHVVDPTTYSSLHYGG